MVGRSSETSRESLSGTGRGRWTEIGSEGHCMLNGPGPLASIARRTGANQAITGNRMIRPDRKQSSHSSDETAQQNTVERRRAGRWRRNG